MTTLDGFKNHSRPFCTGPKLMHNPVERGRELRGPEGLEASCSTYLCRCAGMLICKNGRMSTCVEE